MIFVVLLFPLFMACDDGNFDEPVFDFENTLNTCGSYVMYRTNSENTEALILSIDDAVFPETEGVKEINFTADMLRYRVFDEAVSSAYFCADVPPLNPQVIKEWTSMSGNGYVEITTSFEYNEQDELSAYQYDMTFKNLLLESGDQQLVFETYEFGSFKVSVSKAQ